MVLFITNDSPPGKLAGQVVKKAWKVSEGPQAL